MHLFTLNCLTPVRTLYSITDYTKIPSHVEVISWSEPEYRPSIQLEKADRALLKSVEAYQLIPNRDLICNF